MNTEQIRCFMAAAKTESFAKAAETMYMTQPTFGRYISSLEKEWGFRLFERYGNRPKKLTPSGEVMYHAFTYLMEYYESFFQEAQQYAQEKKMPLRIGMLEGQLLDSKLSKILQRFSMKEPEADFTISRYNFSGLREAVQRQAVDVGITLSVDVENNPDFTSIPIYHLPNELVLLKSHPLAKKENLHLSDFKKETFVTIEPRDSVVVSGMLQKTCEEAGFRPKIKTVYDMKEQSTIIEEGKGISAFNTYHHTCNHPLLAHISLPEFPDVSFSAFWLNDDASSLLLSFVDLLREHIEENEKEKKNQGE